MHRSCRTECTGWDFDAILPALCERLPIYYVFTRSILCSVMRICPTGLCFGLLVNLAGLPVTAFLCLPVENGCFWLPAIDDGKECLGLPALRPSEFAKTLEEMTQSL